MEKEVQELHVLEVCFQQRDTFLCINSSLSSLSYLLHFLKVEPCEEKKSFQTLENDTRRRTLLYDIINRPFWKVLSISDSFDV